MNPQVWWFLARASGIVSFLLLTASVLFGIVLSTDLFPRSRRPAWLRDLHRGLAGLTVCFMAIHIGALVADSYVHFGVTEVLVPFASEWKPWQVGLGVIALWGLVAVELTSLAMRRLPRRFWRWLHMTSYVTFVLACLHGVFAGSDAAHPLYVAMSIGAVTAVAFATTYRILSRPTRPVTIDAVPADQPVRRVRS